MVKSAFKIETAFSAVSPRLGQIAQLVEPVDKSEASVIEQVEYESSVDWEEESSADYFYDSSEISKFESSSKDQRLWSSLAKFFFDF